MKLSAWAKQQGLSYKTTWRMWESGTLQVRPEQLATGTIILHLPEQKKLGAALYARVCGHDQKALETLHEKPHEKPHDQSQAEAVSEPCPYPPSPTRRG